MYLQQQNERDYKRPKTLDSLKNSVNGDFSFALPPIHSGIFLRDGERLDLQKQLLPGKEKVEVFL